MVRGWGWAVVLAVCGVFLASWVGLRGGPGVGLAVLVVFLGVAGVHSPLVFPRSVGALEAQRRSALDGRPVVYWRPGCAYCLRLRLRLGRGARRLHWVDIWRDRDGAAVVRAINDGNETVPTVVVDGRPHTNPDPEWVRKVVRSGG
ncbi:glutaredoxin domain-containing protein [Streptomyces sp. NPDC101166]|uniref:glutaredoxin domain-containing protein n=1 Tax=Streptomyces sp. NPDC101166 TaxID=3366120 RepID=UPI0037FAADFC